MDEKEDKIESLSRRLQAKTDGVLLLDGVRTLILPAAVLTSIAVAGEQILGRGVGGVLYLAGHQLGHHMVECLLEQGGPGADRDTMIRGLAAEAEARGLGRVEILSLDLETGRGSLRVYGNPYAEPARHGHLPACHFPAGLWAGAISALSGKEVMGDETRCSASDYCEYSLYPWG